MALPAGSGANFSPFWYRVALLCATLLSIAPHPLVAQPQGWAPVGNFVLAPGAAKVLLIAQTGPDLIVRVQHPDGSYTVQDGHDNRFGTEVVLLENTTAQAHNYQVDVLPRYSGLAPGFQLTELPQPATAERSAARHLQRAAQLAYGNDHAASLAQLRRLWAELPSYSPLYESALLHYLQALLNEPDYTALMRVHDAVPTPTNLSTRMQRYLDWIRAAALWQLRDIDAALTAFSTLDARLREYPGQLTPGAYLDQQNIRAQWGATIVNDGLRDGNEARIREGAQLIDAALAQASAYADYRLLGELHNYVSGYSNMLYNRIDEGGLKALDLAEFYYARAGDLRSLAGIKSNKAYSLLGQGHIGPAQALYREALSIAQQTDDAYHTAFYQTRLGVSYLYTGDYSRAEYLLRDGNQRFHALGLMRVATPGEIELAICYRLQERHQDAVNLLERLSATLSDDQWVEESLRIHTELARDYLALQDIPAARAHQQQAAQLSTRVKRLDFRLDHLGLEAGILLAEDRPDAAIALLEPALRELNNSNQEAGQRLLLYDLLAASYFAAGRSADAIDTGRQALDLVADIRTQLDIVRQGPAFAASTHTITSRHIEHLFTLYETERERQYLDEAFLRIQQIRGMSLRQSRALQPLLDRTEQGGATEELAALWTRMNAANQALLAASIDGRPLQALEEELLASQEAYRLQDASITPAVLPRKPTTLTLAALQQALPNDTLALGFHLGAAASWRLAISRDTVELTRLPTAAALAPLMQRFLADMDANANFDATAHQELARLLLPETTASTQRTLVIETHGPLSLLPWSALPVPSSNDYRPAGSLFTAIQTISLSDYFAEPSVAPRVGPVPAIAVFADPVFDTGSITDATVSGWMETLQPLPFTRLEADAIRARFEDRNPLVFTGHDASISNLLTAASRNAEILHIATHGFSDRSSSFLSGLAFSAEADNPSGLLTIEEIARHSFHNRLVVISGCETGVGQVLAGEGVMGLARAFLAQGANTVVATLWPISDRATAHFMSHFYTSLSQGNTTATALQQAQLALRQDPRYAHPFYWGGFVLTVAEPAPQSSSV